MSLAASRERHATHVVSNQPPPLEGIDLFAVNRPLVEALAREGAGWGAAEASALGAIAGGDGIRWGFEANEHPPRLRTHDRFGRRVDQVEFHPAWHALMQTAVTHRLHALPWIEQRPGGHAARAAMSLTWGQIEAGHGCPVTMTFAAVPALRAGAAELAAAWEPTLTSSEYDPRDVSATEKAGALCGMGMTEKQGGSDVRANTTTAQPLGGLAYELTGHKWFCSAPMCDLFLVLAKIEGEGLTCFALPRWRPDGERNAFHLQRLKDKLGNRSNASSEVEFAGAWAQRVGEPGRGVPTIIEMVNHTRLDCVIGSSAGMRWAVALATHHAAHRQAFGRLLIEQPLMANVLADLCVESEAATLAAMRLARAYDEAQTDPAAQAFKRIATAVMKYWVCKRAAPHAAEALEVLGGNGYVEESGMPRVYREAPLNSIWEGSGNVMCLDVLRALAREPDAAPAFLAELDLAAGADPRLDAQIARVRAELEDFADVEQRARRVVEAMALALQGSLIVRHSPPAVAEAFCAARLAGDAGHAFGTLPPGLDLSAIVERHLPVV